MDRVQFNSLVLGQSNLLKDYAKNLTKNYDDANDLVQETMLKAVHYFENFKEGTNLKGWLVTIMKNTFINNYRRAVKSKSVITVEEEISSVSLRYSASNNRGENKCMLDDINYALAKLPEDLYICFIMFYEGYKYDEIAKHLAIPVGTVKTRIHIARKRLKSTLSSYKLN
ncbi:RNA polymerase sigma factor [Sphingobacterium pedocola]|uniref:RNA polymerase subunit sigma n=1 Tax=Sphingobacterium pedocola TaxID=2082722 RepID=A0ABR9TAY0_9SPHI|nr:sigma-70 family RNA polymerase sigma factor [Sphingobacterium pedocola]MBE8722522.1 RNA polymerase subunit sigma [Sphingobacterium pedocola]